MATRIAGGCAVTTQFPAAPSTVRGGQQGPDITSTRDISLAAALREHSGRMARAEAFRYQLAMGLLGFVGGLIVVVPLVLWLAPQHGLLPLLGIAQHIGGRAVHSSVDAGAHRPALVSAPTIASRAAARDSDIAESTDANEPGQGSLPAETLEALEQARRLIRAGEIAPARRLLSRADLQQSGQALFMLAETYDPNVLAALGAMDVHAETPMARRYYEAALNEGVTAAAPRLEALE